MFGSKEDFVLFAVGHMALAYLLAKSSGKLLKITINIPLVFVLSIIPDIDLIFEVLFSIQLHRGPTHSLIFAFLLFIPFFIFFKKKALPYFFSLVSHSILADFFVGGQLQLLWPLSTRELGASQFGIPLVLINDPLNVALEFLLFIGAILVMLKTRDILKFLRSNLSNLLLIIPISTVLLPTFTSYPLQVPALLVLPHLFFLIVFTISVLIVVFKRILL
ncbi:MAG: metal-dependent hydrolase [Candidatus Lokiarchaeota archaeon]|nr:metal-dependent hydrolase [Candidatus Lokiarchaeota archaeon]